MSPATLDVFSPSACRERVRAWHFVLLHKARRGRPARDEWDDLAAIKAVLASEGEVFRSAAEFAEWTRQALHLTPEEAQTWLGARSDS